VVGIIPFIQNDWIVKRSFPLKAYEYYASGLDVVSVPIDSLMPETNFAFAEDKVAFARIVLERCRGFSPRPAEITKSVCSPHDYDTKFAIVLATIVAIQKPMSESTNRPVVGVLYDQTTCESSASLDELVAFQQNLA